MEPLVKSDLIDRVEFDLREGFWESDPIVVKAKSSKLRNAVPTCRGDEIALSYKGWGYVGITIHWVAELGMSPY